MRLFEVTDLLDGLLRIHVLCASPCYLVFQVDVSESDLFRSDLFRSDLFRSDLFRSDIF